MRSDLDPKAWKQFVSVMAITVGLTVALGLAMLNVARLAAQAPIAQAHFAFPDTPAAKQLQAWLAAFDSGDRATIQAFVDKVMLPGTPANFVDQTIQIRNQFGGFDFQKVEESTDVRFVALAEARVGQAVRIIVEVDAAEPHRITSILLQPASPPGNTPPPPEMTEAEAAVARTQPSFHQLSAWLAAFNSGDRAEYRQFLENNFPARVSSLNQEMDFRARTGGFEFRKLEQGSATRVSGLVQERDSDQFARFTLEVEPAEPHRIVLLSVLASLAQQHFRLRGSRRARPSRPPRHRSKRMPPPTGSPAPYW
jgi:hypothetical protein